MALLRLILPISSDNVEACRRLCQEMIGSRREQYETSRRQLGIVEERVTLLPAPRGAVALIFIDVEEPKGFLSRLANSTHPFDLWFRRRLREMYGIDLVQSATHAQNDVLLEWQQHDHANGE